MQVSSTQLVSIKKMYKAFPLARMKAYEPNPRLDGTAVEEIEQSLSVFGAVAPIILDEENRICCGDKRLKAAEKAGIKTFPAVVCSFADAAAFQAYNIVDNQAATKSAWDSQELDAVWEGLQAQGWTFDALAFDDGELERILASVGEDLSGPDPNAVPAIPTKARTKPGDLWVLGHHRLLCGDATKVENVELLMDGAKVDCVWTDPPYGVKYGDKLDSANPMGYKVRSIQNDDLGDEELEALIRAAYTNISNHSVPGCTIYAACPPGKQLPIAIAAFTGSGFDFRWQLVWVKNSLVLSRADYHFRHENILYGWKPNSAHWFVDDRTQDSVFEVDRPSSSPEHPTMKPVALVVQMLQNSSKHGAIVCDPFLGSGATMIACEQLSRKCYGIEIEPIYVDVAVKRWEQFTGAKARLVRGGRKSKR